MTQQTGQHRWKTLRRLAGLFHGRLPTWAVLILVLFGGGGVFYAAHDFLKTLQPVKHRTSSPPVALPISIEASFFPDFATKMPAGVIVQVTDSNSTLPNVKVLIDFETARLQSCEVRSPSAPQLASGNETGTTYTLKVVQLLPNETIQLYCLVENPQKLEVTVNSVDSDGTSLGFQRQMFTRSSDSGESGFHAFLIFMTCVVLVAVAGCVIYIVIGLTGRLSAWLSLFRKSA